MASLEKLLAESNPVLAKVPDGIFGLAKFVTTNLNWVLKCDESFWYFGNCDLVMGSLSENQTKTVKEVCSILNNAMSQLTKIAQPDLFATDLPSKVLFQVRDGSIFTEVRGVRDVPSVFPYKSLLNQIDLQRDVWANPTLPPEVAMVIYTKQLQNTLLGFAANVSLSAAQNKFDLSLDTLDPKDMSFAERVQKQRENSQIEIAA